MDVNSNHDSIGLIFLKDILILSLSTHALNTQFSQMQAKSSLEKVSAILFILYCQ